MSALTEIFWATKFGNEACKGPTSSFDPSFQVRLPDERELTVSTLLQNEDRLFALGVGTRNIRSGVVHGDTRNSCTQIRGQQK